MQTQMKGAEGSQCIDFEDGIMTIDPSSLQEALAADAILRANLWPWAPAGLPIAAICMIDLITYLGEASTRVPTVPCTMLKEVNALYGIQISEAEYGILGRAYCSCDLQAITGMVHGLTELVCRTQM
jgi:hypothetical protein